MHELVGMLQQSVYECGLLLYTLCFMAGQHTVQLLITPLTML